MRHRRHCNRAVGHSTEYRLGGEHVLEGGFGLLLAAAEPAV